MFQLSTRYLNASGWTVDSCMARIGAQGMDPGFFVQRDKLHECLLVDGGLAHGENW